MNTATMSARARKRKKKQPRRKRPAFSPIAVPSAYELHVMKRLGCGFSQATFAAIRRVGVEKWLETQLSPATVAEAPLVAAIESWFSPLRRTPAEKAATDDNDTKPAWTYENDLGNATMLRRMCSNRQLLETMVDFWSNHLHISAGADRVYLHHADYDQMLRRNALGRFDDLLVAASTHPAMSLYLDNWRSKKNAPNENQGRELLELHSVTPAAGYTEDMVKASAVLLSGYSIRTGTYEAFYDSANHTTGAVKVLGFSHANTDPDGRAAAEAYLRYLARHPDTARTVARRMAVRFVRDQPSEELVGHLAEVFTRSGTDIRATLKALVAHPEFRTSAGQKVRTPVDDLVATARALGVTPLAPTSENSFANALNWVHGGGQLYGWPRPDGAPETNQQWVSPGRMLRSFRMHWHLAGGYWPKQGVSYVAGSTRMPRKQMTFGLFFDHLSRSMIGRASDARSLEAACLAVDLAPGSIVTRTHRVA
ncbi:MAG: DUF1800 domain-containing protein, partial [Marmoricola sp.]